MVLDGLITEYKTFFKVFLWCCVIFGGFILSLYPLDDILPEGSIILGLLPTALTENSIWMIISHGWIFFVCMLLIAAVVYIFKR